MIVHTVHAEVDNANKPGFVKRGAGCAIQAVFVVDTTSVGYNQITVPLKGKLPRIVPFGVISGQPSCQNGAQGKNGACMCAGHWTGADCSIPVCQNQGVLNTQASACHCNESEFYGLACENSKLSNFWLH
ncbi:hypothetical protein L596_000486 [Steinernema carpocapsae]|nr:hypothetical protein L596_000486 [Steinernema carpocapsae]